MSTIQNLKNFIRHGKQARLVTPHAEPTTNVSPIHAEHQRQPQGSYPPAAGNLDAIDSRLGNGQAQAPQKSSAETQSRRARDLEIEQIVAEERSQRNKMPKYPGLERWILTDKMGDGAFSNVYRAKDSTGEHNEVAIKVVRKFEMNSNQVGFFGLNPCCSPDTTPLFPNYPHLLRVMLVLSSCTLKPNHSPSLLVRRPSASRGQTNQGYGGAQIS